MMEEENAAGGREEKVEEVVVVVDKGKVEGEEEKGADSSETSGSSSSSSDDSTSSSSSSEEDDEKNSSEEVNNDKSVQEDLTNDDDDEEDKVEVNDVSPPVADIKDPDEKEPVLGVVAVDKNGAVDDDIEEEDEEIFEYDEGEMNKEGGDEEDGEMDGGIYNDSDSELEDSSEGIDEDELNEIDDLLEQGLPESQRVPKRKRTMEEQAKRTDSEYNEKEIIVLEEKGKNTFEVLPGGWIEVRHSSGMPLYLHRKTRICTLAKPYFLGPGSVRRHSIPLSAIPCLAYRRALENEKLPSNNKDEEPDSNAKPDESAASLPKIDENADSEKEIGAEKVAENTRKEDLPIETSQVSKCPFNGMPLFPAEISPSINPGSSELNQDSTSRKRKSIDDIKSGQKRTKLEDVGVKIIHDGENTLSVTNNDETTAVLQPDISHIHGVHMLPLAKVATAKENNSMYSITPVDLQVYCKSLFKFKSVKCKRFKTWSARRKHTKDQKRLQLQRPSLPEGVKLISFPVHNGGGSTGENGKGSKEYIMNPQGKSSVCILHEYVQHALRKQPGYIFRELENAATPYAATVVINTMQYGTGYGSSKKQAKADAAKATLEILIPQMREQLDGKKGNADNEFDFIAFFEPFGLLDIGISKWCKNFSEPPPYGLLLTCLQRNFGQGINSNVKFDMVSTQNQSNRFQMQVGEHVVQVTAANKREGKQLASQSLLSKLHPNVSNFGAFIKLYGNSSIKSVKEKKQEEQQITTLQSKASANSPNWAILSKLKEEMQKLVSVQKLNDVLSRPLLSVLAEQASSTK